MASSSSSNTRIQFSAGEDVSGLQAAVEGLQQQGWEVDEEGMGLRKKYSFKSYFKAVTFLNMIASESAVKKHHPTMIVKIGSVEVHWTTHQPRGLSGKDIAMARHCDEGAEVMGAVAEGEGKKCR